MQTVLITGGLGFVGTNLTNFLARKGYRIVIVDKGTYAADPANLDCQPDIFIRDLCCGIQDVLTAYKPQIIINLAAESHVDNSIKSSLPFWQSNVLGTATLMEQIAKIVPEAIIIHFSTDEIYGPAHVLNLNGFSEEEPFNPVSPYACSKAAQELAVKSTVRNYGLKNVCIVRPNNIYGPRQHKEKFIPTIVNSALNDKPIPVYGDGKQQRPWLFIDDLCQAVYLLMSNRNKWYKEDEFFTYNIQAARHDEEYNIDLVKKVLTLLNKPDTLISYVEDRKNHDRRYLTNGTSFRADFNWEPLVGLNDGLKETTQWYKEKLNG